MATHFDKIATGYHEIQYSLNNEVYLRIGELLNSRIANQTVLDIGNGGYFPYDIHLPSSIIAVDVSSELLKKITSQKVKKVVGDARTLTAIENDSVDVVLLLFCIHHINGKNEREAIMSMNEILKAARLKLKKGGRLIIAEAILNPTFYFIEKLLYKVFYFFMKIFGRDMVFFHSDANIISSLTGAFQNKVSDIFVKRIKLKESIDPIAGAFPGLIRIPPWLIYSRHIFYEVLK
jgi:ubiquinone/menaquinone biosynthesis C-methylase UbiE